MIKEILIVGYGYTAQHLSTTLNKHNINVSATTRDSIKIQKNRKSAVKLILLEPHKASIDIKKYDAILFTAPPNSDGTDPLLELMKDQLIQYKSQITWIGYLSSTSVYGDHKGKWVDENSKPNAKGERGKKRMAVELSWLALFEEFSLPIHIFRLAGIYGPSRNSLAKILNGKNTSVIKKGQVFSRIHVSDICRALYESIKRPTPGEIYNLSDDLPCAPELVDEYAAMLLKKPPLMHIPFDEACLSALAKEFYQDCRKVSNKKFKSRFNFKLLYPNYKTGLNSLYNNL